MNHHFSRLASIFSATLITVGIGATSLAENQGISISKKPLPTGVFQRYGISSGGGIVELKDGSLMLWPTADRNAFRTTKGGRGTMVNHSSATSARVG